jgi:hypothetical protein
MDWRPRVQLVLKTGKRFDLAAISGHPAVVYQEQDGGSEALRYRRAADPNGVAWGGISDIATLPLNDTGYLRLLASPLEPRIAYIDEAYLHGGDIHTYLGTGLGSSWGGHATVNAAGHEAGGFALAGIGGIPTLAYVDAASLTGMQIFVRRAQNADGAGWNPGLAVAAVNNRYALTGNGLFDHKGLAAFCYRTEQPPAICYQQAQDEELSGFANAVVVLEDPAEQAVDFCMASVHDIPFLVFRDAEGLKYTFANDNNGASWTSPRMIDPNESSFPSLCEIGGHPAVAYYRGPSATGSLLYATWQFE